MPPDALADQVKTVPILPEEGATEQEPVMVGLETVTAVHAPQLLPSLDSVIVPVPAEEFLSAQTRMYLVVPPSPEGKVYERDAVPVPLTASAVDCVCVPMSVAPVPEASLAF